MPLVGNRDWREGNDESQARLLLKVHCKKNETRLEEL